VFKFFRAQGLTGKMRYSVTALERLQTLPDRGDSLGAIPAIKQRLMAVRILDHNFSPAIDRQNQGDLLLFGPPGVRLFFMRKGTVETVP